jgi:hypothetical protein
MTAVFDHSQSKGAGRLVLLSMADEANDEGYLTAYRRSHRHIAGKANVDEGTVGRVVKELAALGELEVLKMGNGRASGDYRIVLPGLRIEGSQDATPAPAPRHPRGLSTPPQGSQDETPIIPFSPSDNPVHPTSPVDAVFDAWLASTKKTARTVLDAKRRRLIESALKSHPLGDVLDAVRGWENSPHHRGENGEGKVWNDLGLLLRDAGKIEQFRDLARGPRLQARPGAPARGPHRPTAIDTDRTAPSGVIRSEDL